MYSKRTIKNKGPCIRPKKKMKGMDTHSKDDEERGGDPRGKKSITANASNYLGVGVGRFFPI